MKRHTKRIVAIALLAIAGGAFCVDRFVVGYGGPQAAAAAPVAHAEAPKGHAAPVAPESSSDMAVSKRLAGLKERMPPRSAAAEADAFTTPAAWHIDAPVEASAVATPGKPIVPEAPKFVLSTVIGEAGDHSAAAIVNGKIVRVGDVVEGYEVRSVKPAQKPEPASAVLTGPAGEITLEIGGRDQSKDASKGEPAKAPRGKP